MQYSCWLESVKDLSFRLGIQTKVHFSPIFTKIINRTHKDWAYFQISKYSEHQSYEKLSATQVFVLMYVILANLNLRNPIFPFLNRELIDLRNIYVVNLKTGHSKKMSYVGEFAT